MLPLVIGGAASVKPVALVNQAEGMKPVAPLIRLGPDDVTMPVRQDRRQRRVFDTLGMNFYIQILRLQPHFPCCRSQEGGLFSGTFDHSDRAAIPVCKERCDDQGRKPGS